MKTFLHTIAKHELTPLKLEHVLLFAFGGCITYFAQSIYHSASGVGQVIYLIIYLGLLVGIAPVPMARMKSNSTQVMYAGLFSGLLDSFIILMQCKKLPTLEINDRMEVVPEMDTVGTRAKLLALMTMAALIGGLIIWFGEVYAAGLFNNDRRTGILSALYIMPPVLLFLLILGFHANKLPVWIDQSKSEKKALKRDVVEFGVGIAGLLLTHNPLLCLGILVMYAVVTRQDDQLIEVWKHETEVSVMLVLLIALVAGSALVTNFIEPLSINEGLYLPIIPAGIQAVLWGPLYEDPNTHFFLRLTTLSTGALLLPVSSLVGVMLFKKLSQWWVYMRYSIPYAFLWYIIMRIWFAVTYDTPVYYFLDRWGHAGNH